MKPGRATEHIRALQVRNFTVCMVAVSLGAVTVLLGGGVIFFRRVERTFADVI